MELKDIYYKYIEAGLDIKDVVTAWKEDKLNPEALKYTIGRDLGIRIASSMAKTLYMDIRAKKPEYTKLAKLNVEWIINQNDDGFYIARRENDSEDEIQKVASSEVMSNEINIEGHNIILEPITCPAKTKGIQDYTKSPEGSPACINGSEFCKYFESASISDINHKRDIICKIDTNNKKGEK